MHEFWKIIHSNHPIIQIVEDILAFLNDIWNYPILKTENNQSVALSNIFIGLFLFILALRCAKILSIKIRNRLHHNKKMDASVVISLERISHYVFILLFTIFVMEIVNVPLTTLTVIGTTLAVGFGLGTQTLVNNFVSGLIILMERPIKMGDIIEIKDLEVVGQVMHIGARCVCVRSSNNINILIPNSIILQDTLINWTLDDSILKIDLDIFLDHDNDLAKIDQVIYKILDNNDHILKEPAARILLKSLAKETLCYAIEFWINLADNVHNRYIINDINRAIHNSFKSQGISLSENPKNGNVYITKV